jgi:hypothetical protein
MTNPLLLPLLAGLFGALLLTGCQPNGQAQTAPGEVQMPGAHAALGALNEPPDEWSGPGRGTPQTAEAPRR